MPASLLIRNAQVFTVDPGRPWAEAVAVEGDRIAWVGDDAEAAGTRAPDTEVVDAGGCHRAARVHRLPQPRAAGSNPLEVDLAGAATLDEVKARIRAHADAHPEHEWIEGVGFNYSAMPGGRMPRGRTSTASPAAGPRSC